VITAAVEGDLRRINPGLSRRDLVRVLEEIEG